ncbi:MAG: glycosyl transferase family 2, partial [Bacteroidota bacterium]
VSMYDVNEVIFCSRDLSSNEIISRMLQLSKLDLEYKIAPPESLFIIGSNSIDDQGDLYLLDVDAITSSANRRKKRILDVGVSLFFILAIPLLVWMIKKPIGFLKNIFLVLFGKLTWVGLSDTASSKTKSPIRLGVLTPADAVASPVLDDASITRLNELYVRDYDPVKDIRIIYKCIPLLGS